ncbi:hypothetical protein HHK36_028272 [Tetracentron sinense]|uniref:Uncharacterized protein n=1 Tax=Tetracentron sinense TaxID=13715 RepID=A0A834YFI0_TETSI|nr:hypothetical protein HHK36_028272 [Tetracentron sinense]
MKYDKATALHSLAQWESVGVEDSVKYETYGHFVTEKVKGYGVALFLCCSNSYCMAANSNGRGFVSFGRRFFNQIWSGSFRDPTKVPSPPISAFRRGAHISVYDKNVDDQVRPSVVPDDVIQPQSDKYWGPHPQTGVFGPTAEDKAGTGGERGHHSPPANGGDSVLEQKAWFRPDEDVAKPDLS